MQGFEEINGTGAVPNSDIPSWVVGDAAGKSSPAPAPSVDVPNRFTLPVNRGSVNDASSLNGEQTCESRCGTKDSCVPRAAGPQAWPDSLLQHAFWAGSGGYILHAGWRSRLLDAAVLVLCCVTISDNMLKEVCALCSSRRHISWHH